MRSNPVGHTGTLALLLVSALARPALATDVSDELSAGALSSSATPGSSPFLSDRLGGSLDPNDKLSLSLDTTFTRYFHAKGAPGESIWQLAAASDYSPNDHLSFGADVRGSPPSAATADDGPGTPEYRYKSSAFGGGLSAEYDTATDGDADTIADTYLGVTSYRTSRRARGSKKTTASLTQWRGSLGVTEELWRTTDLGLTGTYYLYSNDPVDTGYVGPSIWGRGGVSEGVPLEPLRWAVRPTVRQRLGPVKLSAYVQYGRYVADAGFSVMAALKAQVKVSEVIKLWAQFGFQRDGDNAGETLSIPWGSVGARVML